MSVDAIPCEFYESLTANTIVVTIAIIDI